MGIVRFDIELDNPANMYRKGSVVSGKVYLDLDSPKSVKGKKQYSNSEYLHLIKVYLILQDRFFRYETEH